VRLWPGGVYSRAMTPPSDAPGPMLWIERPDVREGPVARVAMVAAVDGQYSYAVPDELADKVEPGRRVLVPFGRNRKPSPAFCVSVGRETWTSTLKPVADVIDDHRLLDNSLLELGEWISRYYFCPLGRVLSAMVPEAIRKQSGFKRVRIVRLAQDIPDDVRLTAKRRAVIDTLKPHPEGLPIDELTDVASKSVIAAMAKANLVTIDIRKEPAAAPDFDQPGDEPTFELNPEQRRAIDRIVELARAGEFRAAVLFGISGSGKTEVYIRAVRAVLEMNKQAIILVPEIALTTQMVIRLTSRFRDVAVIHSGLTGVQRSLTFAAIERGEKRVVIGTRSAVFAPCPDLGMIVVDEEQESSYKNLQSPRFHTRDVAIKRAQMLAIPIVLGSATPSLETWQNCDRLAHFERIELPRRVSGLPMPEVDFVDMQIEGQQRKGIHLLSRRMEKCLTETLDAGQQAILLLNRRGYANYLVCARCRTPIVCQNCRTNMVFHQTTGKAICHHCSAGMTVPKRCGDITCGGTLIRFGMGTQRVEEEVKTKFPDVRAARADSDTMTHARHYDHLVRDFESGEIVILIGTQMIAKGLDFPNVSFVGVVNADTSLAVPDFRAAERTFQLVTQVAGRAGRADVGGRVIIQSFMGLSPAIRCAANHDFAGFADHELPIRRRLAWPPFSRLARVIVTHRQDSTARSRAKELAEAIRQHITDHNLSADVLGPQTAPLSRLRNQYRYDFLIRAANTSRLMNVLDHLRHHKTLTPNTKNTTIDVDPASLL